MNDKVQMTKEATLLIDMNVMLLRRLEGSLCPPKQSAQQVTRQALSAAPQTKSFVRFLQDIATKMDLDDMGQVKLIINCLAELTRDEGIELVLVGLLYVSFIVLV